MQDFVRLVSYWMKGAPRPPSPIPHPPYEIEFRKNM
jgi:hypothetical protein